MPVQTEHRFPLDLSVLDAAGSRVTLAGLRGQARAVAVSFMRTGTCPVRIQHARALARRTYPPAACSRSWRYPDRRHTPPGSEHPRRPGHRRVLRWRPGAPGGWTAPDLLLQHSGIMPVDSARVVRYRLATALPAGSFDGPALQAAIDRL